MSFVCPVPPLDVPQMRSLLMTVDCNSRLFAESGYRALTDQGGIFPAALTALLTIYVALLGYRLLFGIGSARVADAPVIALKIGAILALTLNWATFQTLVFDVAYKAPIELGRTVAGPMGPRSGDLVSGAQGAYDELLADAKAVAKQGALRGATGAQNGTENNAANSLSSAAETLFMATVGMLAVALIAVGVLTALGPIFIALFLFSATRGLFVGWVRAIVVAALLPMVGWAITTLMLVALRPGLATLAAQRVAGEIELDAVTAVTAIVTVFAAAQLALVGGAILIGSGFRLRRWQGMRESRVAPKAASAITSAGPAAAATRSQMLAESLRRPTSGLRTSESNLLTAYASEGGPRRIEAAPGAAPFQPAVRLGETYRRPAFKARTR